MKIQYTSRLYFKDYYIRVLVHTVSMCKHRYTFNWVKPDELLVLSDFCQTAFAEKSYIIKDRYIGQDLDGCCRFHQMIYLKTEDQLSTLMQTFGASIVEITKPYDQSHQEQLSVRNVVVVRDQLLYKKYQYVVYFKYDPKKEVWKWLTAYSKGESDMKIDRMGSWPRVYLVDDLHLTSIKLMWPEQIDYMKTIRLLTPTAP